MIEELLPLTENKLKILKFIYENEDTYLLNIARGLKLHPFSLKRTIDNLLKKKILISENIGKTKVIRLNKTFNNYKELVYEIEKYKQKTSNKILKNLIKNIQIFFSEDEEILSCCLFGSYVRKAETKESDIDILFIVKNKKGEILKKCSEWSIMLHKEISPIIVKEEEFQRIIKLKDPAYASLTKKSQRIIVLGIPYFLKTTKTI
jgi:predicted nucleotidyltransferase